MNICFALFLFTQNQIWDHAFIWRIKTIYAHTYNNTAQPTLLNTPVVDFPVEADMVKVQ